MFEDDFQKFLSASAAWEGLSADAALEEATASLRRHPLEDARVGARAASIRDLPPPGGAWVAVSLGAWVEQSGRPELSGGAVIDAYRAMIANRVRNKDERDDAPWMRYLAQAAVAHLARSKELRAACVADSQLMEALEEYGGLTSAAWVRSVLLKSSDDLVVLHAPTRRGYRLRYENVETCFHLFSLLQAAIGERLSGGRKPDEAVARAARGESNDDISDAAWWHYGSPDAPQPDIISSIWGESLTRDLPRIDGQQVILLWPPVMQQRSWDAGFFHPIIEAAPARLEIVAPLSPEEADALAKRLNLGESDTTLTGRALAAIRRLTGRA